MALRDHNNSIYVLPIIFCVAGKCRYTNCALPSKQIMRSELISFRQQRGAGLHFALTRAPVRTRQAPEIFADFWGFLFCGYGLARGAIIHVKAYDPAFTRYWGSVSGPQAPVPRPRIAASI